MTSRSLNFAGAVDVLQDLVGEHVQVSLAPADEPIAIACVLGELHAPFRNFEVQPPHSDRDEIVFPVSVSENGENSPFFVLDPNAFSEAQIHQIGDEQLLSVIVGAIAIVVSCTPARPAGPCRSTRRTARAAARAF